MLRMWPRGMAKVPWLAASRAATRRSRGPTRLLRAAFWAREQSPSPAWMPERELRWRYGACYESPIPPPLSPKALPVGREANGSGHVNLRVDALLALMGNLACMARLAASWPGSGSAAHLQLETPSCLRSAPVPLGYGPPRLLGP